MSRYLLQKSTIHPGWWTLTDTDTQLVCRFEQYRFNETQKLTFLDDDRDILARYTPQEIAGILADMADWGAAYHYNILMPPVEMSERLRIGRILQYHRVKAGLTVRSLAELSGVTFQNISKIEHGRYNVSVDILAKILSALSLRLTVEPTE